MGRKSKTEAPDTSAAIELTMGVIERLTCPEGKSQVFLRDTKAPGLRIRATPPSGKNPSGVKAFVFEAKLHRKTIRRTIGDVRAWTIEKARQEANRLRVTFDEGDDPRELERQRALELAETERKRVAAQVTVGEAWARYLKERQPHWGPRNYDDHVKMTQEGGKPRSRQPDVLTKPGPLAALMPMRLVDVTPGAVETWAANEAKDRPARVRLALRLLKAFLRWAAAEPDLKENTDPTAANAKKAREAAGRAKPKDDCLQRQQLPAWFARVREIQNPVIAAYLQCLLITGARREELAALKWADVDLQWSVIDLCDKIVGRRSVPLTPYVAHLIKGLPRHNEWVFPSSMVIEMDPKNAARRTRYHERKGQQAPEGGIKIRSVSGHIAEPSIAHRQACAAAGVELTLHGLRRSFASLCEWLDVPGGIGAQIQGHAPQGVREQNYIRRPVDLLRVHHNKIEAWMLAQAGIDFNADAPAGRHLAAVA